MANANTDVMWFRDSWNKDKTKGKATNSRNNEGEVFFRNDTVK